jgi:hypothetical protein
LTTGVPTVSIHRRTKFEPMNPAPPVTRIGFFESVMNEHLPLGWGNQQIKGDAMDILMSR